jgi:hypothetical protein
VGGGSHQILIVQGDNPFDVTILHKVLSVHPYSPPFFLSASLFVVTLLL